MLVKYFSFTSSFLIGASERFADMTDKADGYKAVREAFVSGHIGGSLWEINQVTMIAPVSQNINIQLGL